MEYNGGSLSEWPTLIQVDLNFRASKRTLNTCKCDPFDDESKFDMHYN